MEKRKPSREEILNAATAYVLAVMNPQLEGADDEQFFELFNKKAGELLEEKGTLFLGMGPNVSKSGLFSDDMAQVMEFVKGETKKEYSFMEGQLLIYIIGEEGSAVWLKD